MSDTAASKLNSQSLFPISKLTWTANQIVIPGMSQQAFLRHLSLEKISSSEENDMIFEKYRLFVQRSGITFIEISVLESERDLLSNLSQKLVESKL